MGQGQTVFLTGSDVLSRSREVNARRLVARPVVRAVLEDGNVFGAHSFNHVYDCPDRYSDRIAAARCRGWQPTIAPSSTVLRIIASGGSLARSSIRSGARRVVARYRALVVFAGSRCSRRFGAGFIGDELPSDHYPSAQGPALPIYDLSVTDLEQRGHYLRTLRDAAVYCA
jgi:hypothetical protein